MVELSGGQLDPPLNRYGVVRQSCVVKATGMPSVEWIGVEGVGWETIVTPPRDAPRLKYSSMRWCQQEQLRVASLEEDKDAFPLMKLPMSCLSCVLRQLPFEEAAQFQCRVNKRFLAAFRDDTSWRLRTLSELEDAERLYDGSVSWYEFYMHQCRWRISVNVSEKLGRGYKQFDPLFEVVAKPTLPMSDFLHLCGCEGKGKYSPTHYFTGFKFANGSVCPDDVPINAAGLSDGCKVCVSRDGMYLCMDGGSVKEEKLRVVDDDVQQYSPEPSDDDEGSYGDN